MCEKVTIVYTVVQRSVTNTLYAFVNTLYVFYSKRLEFLFYYEHSRPVHNFFIDQYWITAKHLLSSSCVNKIAHICINYFFSMNNYLSLDKLSWALQFLEWLMHFFNCINTPLRSYFHRLRYNLSTFFFKDELSFSLFEFFF